MIHPENNMDTYVPDTWLFSATTKMTKLLLSLYLKYRLKVIYN